MTNIYSNGFLTDEETSDFAHEWVDPANGTRFRMMLLSAVEPPQEQPEWLGSYLERDCYPLFIRYANTDRWVRRATVHPNVAMELMRLKNAIP